MSITGRVDTDRGVAYLIMEDPWSVEEMQGAIGAVASDPDFDPAMGVVVDFTRVTTVPASAEIEQYMAYLGGQSERRNVKRAILVANDLQYGMARMAAAYGEHYSLRVQVYRDLDEALAWLCDEG
jgi:hypothetical protein